MSFFENRKPVAVSEVQWAAHCRAPTLEQIKERIAGELPAQTYLSEKEFSEAIRVSVKTLKNDRAPRGAHRYPVAIRFFGGAILYLRSDVIDCMAQCEMHTRTVHQHRCQ